MSKDLIDALQTAGISFLMTVVFLGGAIYWTFQTKTLEYKKVYSKMPMPNPVFKWIIAILFWILGVLSAVMLIAAVIGIFYQM